MISCKHKQKNRICKRHQGNLFSLPLRGSRWQASVPELAAGPLLQCCHFDRSAFFVISTGALFLSFRPEPPSLSFRPERVFCHFDRSPFIVISTGARFLSFRPERVFCHFDRSPKGGVEKSLKCRNRQNRTSLYGG